MVRRLPLEHIRILDLTQAWSGPFATQILADYGAEVVKVEARQRPDPWRGTSSSLYGGDIYPADGPGARPYNRVFNANSVNRNKSGITLDLSRERGRDLFCRLVPFFDVVTENFTPRVMHQLGLGFAALSAIRPDLVMLSMPAFGGTGPYANFPGIGNTIEPMAGNSSLLGYEGGPPLNSGVMYSDAVAGVTGAAAVLTALRSRERAGRGQHIDLSQQEAMMAMLGPAIVAHSLTGEAPARQGNQDPQMVPHRNYRCRGDDQWVAIAVRNDQDWTRLSEAIGRPELAIDPRFAATDRRRENRTVVDLIIEGWTRERPAEGVEQVLMVAGVPVGKVRTMAEVHGCPQLDARRFIVAVDHPDAGRRRTAGIPVRLSRSPGAIRRPAPGLGQHSADILRRLLHLSDEEIAELIAEGITGDEPILESV
ncbi:MAG: CoA transferase [Chloroflexi bacterium]|nr:CoA transferase [Chloroflexota bacterium]